MIPDIGLLITGGPHAYTYYNLDSQVSINTCVVVIVVKVPVCRDYNGACIV